MATTSKVKFQVRDGRLGEGDSWVAWATSRGDIYLKGLGPAPCKFSFHRSGICKYAKVTDAPRAAVQRWIAPAVPSSPSEIAILAYLGFPTAYLLPSTTTPRARGVVLIPAAPTDAEVAVIEIGLTGASEDAVKKATIGDGQGILMYQRLFDDVAATVRWQHAPWEWPEPAAPPTLGPRDVRFRRRTEVGTYAEARLTIQSPVADGQTLYVLEVGCLPGSVAITT